MKKNISIKLNMILFLLIISLLQAANYDELARNNGFNDPLKSKSPVLTHFIVKEGLKKGQSFNAGEKIGKMQNYPEIMSEKYNEKILEAQNYYAHGDYNKSAKVLEDIVGLYPINPFILNEYARALYRYDREKSFKYYLKLMNYIDKEVNDLRKNDYVVDMWFLDAYWKIATLYLDRGAYDKAKIELLKVYYFNTDLDNLKAIEELYSYLAESYYYTKDFHSARYWCYKTWGINPNNKYVLQFYN